MKGKWQRKIAAFFAVGMVLGTTGCLPVSVKDSLPEDTIEDFEDAYNAMDIQGMLDCIDEKTVKSMTAGMDVMMGLFGAAAGMDLGIEASDLIDMAPLLQSFMGDYVRETGEMPEVDFQVKETYIKGSRATVYFTEANSGENMVINMVKEKGKWYMTLSTRMIAKEDAEQVIIAGEENKEEKNTADKTEEEKSTKKLSEMDLFERIFNSEKLKEAIKEILGDSRTASSTVETRQVERTDKNGNKVMKEVPIIHLSGFPGGKDVYLDEFGIGEVYPNSDIVMIDGKREDLKGAECIGFVRYAQFKMYGKSDNVNAEYFENVLGTSFLSHSDMVDNDCAKLKEVITKAGSGAHIRTGSKQHSMMVTEITEDGFTVIQANGDGKGTVSRETYTWKQYGDSWGKRGISYLKVYKQGE